MSSAVLARSESLASQPGRRAFLPRSLHAPNRGSSNAAAFPARVLVVEDDHLVAMEMEHTLLDAGFVVVGIAVSADAAIAMARGEQPDLAVMDIRLAGVRDGIDAAIDIFNQTGIRCIFASAHSDAATRARALAARPLGWISKPYSSDALVQAVQDALRNRGAR